MCHSCSWVMPIPMPKPELPIAERVFRQISSMSGTTAAPRHPAQTSFPKQIQRPGQLKWGPGIPMVTRHQQHVCRLAQVGSAVFRTELNGDVTVTTDCKTYNVKIGQTSSQLGSGSVAAKTVNNAADGEFPEFGRSGHSLSKSSIDLLPFRFMIFPLRNSSAKPKTDASRCHSMVNGMVPARPFIRDLHRLCIYFAWK